MRLLICFNNANLDIRKKCNNLVTKF